MQAVSSLAVAGVTEGSAALGSKLDWPTVQAALRLAVKPDDYNAWLAELELVSLEPQGLTLSAPTTFIRDWVEGNFKDVVATTVAAEVGVVCPVRFVVKPAFQIAKPDPVAAPVAPVQGGGLAPTEPSAMDIGTRLDERYTFDTFVMGASNHLAFAASQSVARDGAVQGCNPLFMYGGVGLGKTHLMHAVAWEIGKTRPKARVLYVSSERFYNMFVHALRVERNPLKFKAAFDHVDVLMVDDIQFISGKDSTQDEFFHVFNRLVEAGKQVLLTADRSPVDLPNIEDRLKSRMGAGMVVQVHAPDVEMRLAILHSKAGQLGLKIPDDVLNLLGHTIASNVRELEGALNRLVAASRLMGVPLTTDFAREQLADLFRIHTRVATLEDIQKTVADYFKIRVSDMHSPRRQRNLARPRQVAMYFCRKLTSKSLPDIGRAFGGKDHTTVRHGVQAIEDLLTRDAELAEHVDVLGKMLGARS